MIEKILIKSKKQFDHHLNTSWKNAAYVKYYINKPASFPCIAIQTYSPSGNLGSIYEVTDYIYPEDFAD